MTPNRWLAWRRDSSSAFAAQSTTAESVAHQRTSQDRSYRLRSMISIMLRARSIRRDPRICSIRDSPTFIISWIDEDISDSRAWVIWLMLSETFLTSLATTAKPRPISPARVASIKALSERVRVVLATLLMARIFSMAMSLTFCDSSRIRSGSDDTLHLVLIKKSTGGLDGPC